MPTDYAALDDELENLEGMLRDDQFTEDADVVRDARTALRELQEQRDDARYRLGWSKPAGAPESPFYINRIADELRQQLKAAAALADRCGRSGVAADQALARRACGFTQIILRGSREHSSRCGGAPVG